MCTTFDFTFFINFLYNTSLAGNPLICNCANSYSWNQFMAQILNTQSVNVNTVIFQTKCTNAKYQICPAVYFPDPTGCTKNPDSYYALCSSPILTTTTTTTTPTTTTTTTTTSASGNIQPQPNNLVPGLGANSFTPEPLAQNVYDGYIAAIALAILLVLLLLLIVIYYLNPVECNACIFDCLPMFYRCCPCKSKHKREKCYDLFISYNMANERYVLCRLVPFIKGNI